MKYSSNSRIDLFCYFFFLVTMCIFIVNTQDAEIQNITDNLEIKTNFTNSTENTSYPEDDDFESDFDEKNSTSTFNLTLKKNKRGKSKSKNNTISKKNETKSQKTKNKTKINEKREINEEYLKYYENFNLTQEIEKKYDEENLNDKDESYYKNLDNVKVDKKNKKKKKKEKSQESEKEKELRDSEAQEWEDKIHAFLPNNLLTVKLLKGEYDLFFEEVVNVPTTVICAFYVNDDDSKIDFEIYDSNAKLIYRIKAKNRAFYEFNVTSPGIYEFHIDNSRFKNSKKVSFAINNGESKGNKLTLDHLQPIMNRISIVESKMKDAHFSQKMINRKYEGHYDLTKSHNKNIVYYTLIETTIMVLIFIFQFFYIRHLVNSSKS